MAEVSTLSRREANCMVDLTFWGAIVAKAAGNKAA